IARVGLVEAIYSPTDAVDQIQAQNIADALLASYCPGTPEEIQFSTNEIIETVDGGWLEPGDLIDVDLTAPLADGNYLVQQINSQEQDLTVWRHQIIARLQNGPSDGQTLLAKVTQQALTQPNNSDMLTFTFELAITIPGLTNP